MCSVWILFPLAMMSGCDEKENAEVGKLEAKVEELRKKMDSLKNENKQLREKIIELTRNNSRSTAAVFGLICVAVLLLLVGVAVGSAGRRAAENAKKPSLAMSARTADQSCPAQDSGQCEQAEFHDSAW